jgi:hypothetical protein
MSTNFIENDRKPSHKIYKSPRLRQIPTSPSNDRWGRRIFKKEMPTQANDNNNEIAKTEPSQIQFNVKHQNKLAYSNSKIKKNLNLDEKKVIKNSISSKYYRISKNKEELGINPLIKNISNMKIFVRTKDNYIQNQNISPNISNNIQPLFYSNIDLNGDKVNNKNIRKSSYIDRRQKNNENQNKYQYNTYIQPKAEDTKKETQFKYQIKTLPKLQNISSFLKPSQSQLQLKYNTNTSNIKITRIPMSANINYKKSSQSTDRLKVAVGNTPRLIKTPDRLIKQLRNHNIYISDSSRYNSKVYQEKTENNQKCKNDSFNRGSSYIQAQQKNLLSPKTNNYRNK